MRLHILADIYLKLIGNHQRHRQRCVGVPGQHQSYLNMPAALSKVCDGMESSLTMTERVKRDMRAGTVRVGHGYNGVMAHSPIAAIDTSCLNLKHNRSRE